MAMEILIELLFQLSSKIRLCVKTVWYAAVEVSGFLQQTKNAPPPYRCLRPV